MTEQAIALSSPLLSVVIPVFRSEDGLDELYKRLQPALNDITSDWEILFVDDCSPDDSWKVLEELAKLDDRIQIIQLMRNYGQQRAVLTGLAQSRGEFVVTMDDDLQHRPEEIRVLLDAIQASTADVVIGRYKQKSHSGIRRIGTRAVKWLASQTIGVPSSLSMTSFRIIRQCAVREVVQIQHSNPVVGYLLFAVTRRIENVDVHHDARQVGSSNYGLRDLLDYFLCMITDYSDWPLRALGGAGTMLSIGSFAFGLFHLYRYMTGAVTVGGFTTIVLLLTTLSGFILIGMGILGAYLLRLLRRGGPDARVAIREIRIR